MFSSKPTNTLAPPAVPHTIPWLGSVRDVEANSDLFLEQAKRQHGDLFSVTAAGKTVNYVTSAALIADVYKQSKLFSLAPLQTEWLKDIYGASENAALGSNLLATKIIPHVNRMLNSQNVGTLLQSMNDNAHASVHAYARSLQSTEETGPIPTSSLTAILPLVLRLSYTASALAFFGPSFRPFLEASFQPFWTFNSTIPQVAKGFPQMLLPAYGRSRDELHTLLQEYLSLPHQPSELVAGIEAHANASGWSQKDTATLLLATFAPIMANAPLQIFWTIALALQRPEGLSTLTAEIDAARTAWNTANPTKGFSGHVHEALTAAPERTPLLNSTINETLRYTTDAHSLRRVDGEHGFATLGGHTLEKGDTIACSTRSVHMDEKIYPNARSYQPDRFVGNKEVNTEGSKFLPHGAGISMGESRLYTTAKTKTFVSLLLTHLELDVRPSWKEETVAFTQSARGYGTIQPEGDLLVKVSRRAGIIAA